MNKAILNTGIQDFISKNLNTDIVSFLLRKPVFDSISSKELAAQITSKKQAKKKLPTWFETPQIYYPKKLHIEQTSSETAARYKSEIVSGKSLVDLTGGFGVDSYFFSQKMSLVTHCEIDADLAQIASHNFEILGTPNINTFTGDGLQFLKDSRDRFDWLYIDPSRRNEHQGKVFHFSDCIPDVTEHLEFMFASSNNILIKSAPFLDISAGIKELQNIKEIHVVAVNGEVKELLWLLEKDYFGKIQVKTVNLGKNSIQTFDFLRDEEKEVGSSFHLPLDYLYEPNAAILKSGAFITIGNRLSLLKIHKHTHLYTSTELIAFPGRKFIIKECLMYDKKTSVLLKGLKANITIRNFPISVAKIKKKHSIKDGGKTYLFFTTDLNDHLRVLRCEKVT